jgi:hypothetical protein
MSDVVRLLEYPTEKLLELAFAAQRVNKGYEKNTRRYSESQPTTYSNKEIISYSAAYYNQHNKKDSVVKTWIPEDFIPVKVTEEDLAAKDAADKHMRRYTMLAMGNLSEFENDVYSAYCSQVMPINRIGLIAYLPEFVERELKNKIYKQRLKTEFANSKHYTTDPVAGDCEILKVIQISREFDDTFYMHFGAIDGNLVCFARKEGYAEGVVYTISAKIKSQDSERETGLPMTRINYVKLRKTEI